MPAPLAVLSVASLLGTGAGVYTGIQQRKAQKRFAKEQRVIQKETKAVALTERKKQIQRLRMETLAPALTGGRRSLFFGGERGLAASIPRREVLG